MNTTNADASVFDLLIREESPSGECKLCERHADTIKELREALEGILPYIPKSSAKDGGATTYSAAVKAADMVRAAIAKAKGEA